MKTVDLFAIAYWFLQKREVKDLAMKKNRRILGRQCCQGKVREI